MDVVTVLLLALLAQVPTLLLVGWTWFKARAAATTFTWDDTVVRVVEDIARGVVKKEVG